MPLMLTATFAAAQRVDPKDVRRFDPKSIQLQIPDGRFKAFTQVIVASPEAGRASAGHPNSTGAKAYAAAIVATLN